MAVFDGVDDGSNGIRGLLLGVVFLVDDAIEEFAAGHELEDEVDVVFILEDLVELDDVGMVDLRNERLICLAEDLDLVLQRQLVVLAQSGPTSVLPAQPVPLEDLHCDLLSRLLPHGLPHNRKAPSKPAQRLRYSPSTSHSL